MLRHFSSAQPRKSYYFISFKSPICPLAILGKSRWRILLFLKYCRNNARNWLDSMIFHQNLTSVSVIAKLGSQVIPTILCHFEGLSVP